MKSFLPFLSKPQIQKFLVFKYLSVVLILGTSNILMCSIQPLALLYKSLLSLGKDLSFIINPSILKDVALLIIEPIFLGSVTSSKASKVCFFYFQQISNNL